MNEESVKDSVFDRLTDRENVLMTVIAAVDFEEEDCGKSLDELLSIKNSKLKIALKKYILQTNPDIIEPTEIQHRYIRKLLGNLISLKLDKVVDNNGVGKDGLYGLALRDENSGAVGFAFRGTENFTDSFGQLLGIGSPDQGDNIIEALDGDSPQIKSAKEFVSGEGFEENKKYLYGFSKGGNIAMSLLRDENKIFGNAENKFEHCFVFNPFPIKLNEVEDLETFHDKIDALVSLYDPVHLIRDMRLLGDKVRHCFSRKPNTDIGDEFSTGHSNRAIEYNIDDSAKVCNDTRMIKKSEFHIASLLMKAVNFTLKVLDVLPKTKEEVLKYLIEKYNEFVEYEKAKRYNNSASLEGRT